jgi:hypothetical protein
VLIAFFCRLSNNGGLENPPSVQKACLSFAYEAGFSHFRGWIKMEILRLMPAICLYGGTKFLHL